MCKQGLLNKVSTRCVEFTEGQRNANINQRSPVIVWSEKKKGISTFGRRYELALEISDSRDSDICVQSFVSYFDFFINANLTV